MLTFIAWIAAVDAALATGTDTGTVAGSTDNAWSCGLRSVRASYVVAGSGSVQAICSSPPGLELPVRSQVARTYPATAGGALLAASEIQTFFTVGANTLN